MPCHSCRASTPWARHSTIRWLRIGCKWRSARRSWLILAVLRLLDQIQRRGVAGDLPDQKPLGRRPGVPLGAKVARVPLKQVVAEHGRKEPCRRQPVGEGVTAGVCLSFRRSRTPSPLRP